MSVFIETMSTNDGNIQINIPERSAKFLSVEELYDKEKFDLSTMIEEDVYKLLE